MKNDATLEGFVAELEHIVFGVLRWITTISYCLYGLIDGNHFVLQVIL